MDEVYASCVWIIEFDCLKQNIGPESGTVFMEVPAPLYGCRNNSLTASIRCIPLE